MLFFDSGNIESILQVLRKRLFNQNIAAGLKNLNHQWPMRLRRCKDMNYVGMALR